MEFKSISIFRKPIPKARGPGLNALLWRHPGSFPLAHYEPSINLREPPCPLCGKSFRPVSEWLRIQGRLFVRVDTELLDGFG